ncbi:MAG: hypothetical protein JSR61_16125 [Proteobacteria bacterium]|nr:hypothetical protein [Pseudomonadota bacterium]
MMSMIRHFQCGSSMANSGKSDDSDTEMQSDLFGADPVPAYRPDPDKVRSRLQKILAEARAANQLPWEPTTVSLYRTIFPQMTNWLPDDEGAQLRFEFEAELERLKAA